MEFILTRVKKATVFLKRKMNVGFVAAFPRATNNAPDPDL